MIRGVPAWWTGYPQAKEIQSSGFTAWPTLSSPVPWPSLNRNWLNTPYNKSDCIIILILNKRQKIQQTRKHDSPKFCISPTICKVCVHCQKNYSTHRGLPLTKNSVRQSNQYAVLITIAALIFSPEKGQKAKVMRCGNRNKEQLWKHALTAWAHQGPWNTK